MPEEAQLIGYAILAAITLGSFVAVIQKFTQPINDLKLVIQELKTCVASLKEHNDVVNKRLEKHGDEIDRLDKRVGKLETRMDMYHSEHKH